MVGPNRRHTPWRTLNATAIQGEGLTWIKRLGLNILEELPQPSLFPRVTVIAVELEFAAATAAPKEIQESHRRGIAGSFQV